MKCWKGFVILRSRPDAAGARNHATLPTPHSHTVYKVHEKLGHPVNLQMTKLRKMLTPLQLQIMNRLQDRVREERSDTNTVIIEKIVHLVCDNAQVARRRLGLAEDERLELAHGQSAQSADVGKEE